MAVTSAEICPAALPGNAHLAMPVLQCLPADRHNLFIWLYLQPGVERFAGVPAFLRPAPFRGVAGLSIQFCYA
jgi:hypothetical protein